MKLDLENLHTLQPEELLAAYEQTKHEMLQASLLLSTVKTNSIRWAMNWPGQVLPTTYQESIVSAENKELAAVKIYQAVKREVIYRLTDNYS